MPLDGDERDRRHLPNTICTAHGVIWAEVLSYMISPRIRTRVLLPVPDYKPMENVVTRGDGPCWTEAR